MRKRPEPLGASPSPPVPPGKGCLGGCAVGMVVAGGVLFSLGSLLVAAVAADQSGFFAPSYDPGDARSVLAHENWLWRLRLYNVAVWLGVVVTLAAMNGARWARLDAPRRWYGRLPTAAKVAVLLGVTALGPLGYGLHWGWQHLRLAQLGRQTEERRAEAERAQRLREREQERLDGAYAVWLGQVYKTMAPALAARPSLKRVSCRDFPAALVEGDSRCYGSREPLPRLLKEVNGTFVESFGLPAPPVELEWGTVQNNFEDHPVELEQQGQRFQVGVVFLGAELYPPRRPAGTGEDQERWLRQHGFRSAFAVFPSGPFVP